ncbi:unnamed protein product [Fraxinus pennsylvanica]|uniref:Uncharacterized protein n=1 Tax=Fraxinus pennsylvanica TaxID=56036 RepID=A0AAD2AC41_9LAMI|nr:unnamed protein product [Fraxinus pennsylvanica]
MGALEEKVEALLKLSQQNVEDRNSNAITPQGTPLLAGLATAATAYAGRYGIQAWQAFKARPPTARMLKFYEGDKKDVWQAMPNSSLLKLGELQIHVQSLACSYH